MLFPPWQAQFLPVSAYPLGRVKTNAFDHPAPTPASGTLTAFVSSGLARLERCLDEGDDNAGSVATELYSGRLSARRARRWSLKQERPDL